MSIVNEYGKQANRIENHVIVSGRRPWQEIALKNVFPDVMAKLELSDKDRVLDIGCNIGEITIPLSFCCKEVVGIDAEGCIKRLKRRSEGINNIKCIIGDFLETEVEGKYDCILMYSVLPHMNSYEQALNMIIKAANLLEKDGRLLVGDVTNVDKRYRMSMCETGKKINAEYIAQGKKNYTLEEETFLKSIQNEKSTDFLLNDEMIMKLLIDIRKTGKEAYLLPQNKNLPWGYSREDILIKAW